MKKISGLIKYPKKHWWKGRIVECTDCDQRYLLQQSDEPFGEKHELNNKDLIDFINFFVKCPECHKNLGVCSEEINI